MKKTISKVKQFIINPYYRFDWLSNKGFYNKKDDKSYLEKKYELIYKRKLNLDTPILFNEKMQWLKLYDRNPMYTEIADKNLFKNYVKKSLGEGYTFPTLGVYNHFKEIDFSGLPTSFVLKTNHDSGGVIICKDKNEFDKEKAEEKLEKKLKKNYYYGCREWCYKNIKPCIIAEPFITCDNVFGKEGLIDYKFYCFSGSPYYVMVSFGEAEKRHINHKYDMNYNSIDLEFRSESLVPQETFPKPDNFNEMVEVVKKLCVGFPHIRVDLYNVNGKIYVGELTLYSNGGFLNIPLKKDEELGDITDLKLAYKKEI